MTSRDVVTALLLSAALLLVFWECAQGFGQAR